MRSLIVALLCAFAASGALAGNWSSGGGEILEHAQNPWFLDGPGTKPVRYCVAAGADFAVPLVTLEPLVERAIAWWDAQFGNAYVPDNAVLAGGKVVNLHVLVNTSRFTKVDCASDPDLAFQFGTLTTAQAAEFERLQIDLRRYAALTIRTDYGDDLRGKGFIYVSPDRGPDAFRGQNVLPEAWTTDGTTYRLQAVVTHEVGHVLGLAHAATGDSIMAANFAEMTVSTPSVNDIEYFLNGLSGAVFFPRSGEISNDVCTADAKTAKFRAFFAIPAEMGCVRVKMSLGSLSIDMTATMTSDGWTHVGSAEFADGGERRHAQLVTLWLPATQTAFPQLSPFYSSLLGPASSEVQHAGLFRFKADGQTKPIFLQASARFVQIGGVLDGQMVPDLLPVSAYGRALSGWGSR